MNEYQNCIIGYSVVNQTPIHDYNLMVHHKINNSNNDLENTTTPVIILTA